MGYLAFLLLVEKKLLCGLNLAMKIFQQLANSSAVYDSNRTVTRLGLWADGSFN